MHWEKYMATPELNLITAASMGNLEAVKRLMPLEPPGASQRQTLVFAALKDRAACIEALLPICDQTAMNDAFAFAIKEGKFSAATVLLPHITNIKYLKSAVGRSVHFNQRDFFTLALPKACPIQQWKNCMDDHFLDQFGVAPSDTPLFWTWFYEEDTLRQRDVLNQHVGAVGSTSSRKL